MTHESFRQFASQLAGTLGFELEPGRVESPLAFTINDQRVILDQDISTEYPEIIFYTLIGKIAEKR